MSITLLKGEIIINKKKIFILMLFALILFIPMIPLIIASEDYVSIEENKIYEYNIIIYNDNNYEEWDEYLGNKEAFKIDIFDEDIEKVKLVINNIDEEQNHKIGEEEFKGVKVDFSIFESESDPPVYQNEYRDYFIIFDGEKIDNLYLANLIYDCAFMIPKNVDCEALEDAFDAILVTKAISWKTEVKIDETEGDDFLIISLDRINFNFLPNRTKIRIDYNIDKGVLWYMRVEYGGDGLYSWILDQNSMIIPSYRLDILMIIMGTAILSIAIIKFRIRSKNSIIIL